MILSSFIFAAKNTAALELEKCLRKCNFYGRYRITWSVKELSYSKVILFRKNYLLVIFTPNATVRHDSIQSQRRDANLIDGVTFSPATGKRVHVDCSVTNFAEVEMFQLFPRHSRGDSQSAFTLLGK